MPIRRLNAIQKPPEETKEGERFIASIAPSIKLLNGAIDAYNRERDPEQRKKLLRLLYDDLKAFQRRFPNDMLAICPEYDHEIIHELFQDIQSEFTELGMLSVRSEELPSDPLADTIANLKPIDVSQLAKILGTPKYWRPKTHPTDLTGEERVSQILSGYSIIKLRSANNQSFKLTDKKTGKHYLLQLEDRQGVTKNAEMHLRAQESLSSTFLPTLEDRQTSYVWGGEDSGIRQNRNILVMEYVEGLKTVEQDRETHTERKTRIAAAIDIYIQMAEILESVEASGCVFSDMKNSNWLLEPSGKLRISDMKSFLFANQEGQLDVWDEERKNGTYGICLGSRHMTPPEGFKTKPRVGALHAYMLGRNLYQYLTQCDNQYLLKEGNRFEAKPLEKLDFSSEIFGDEEGKKLEKLIKSLMSDSPAERPSMKEVSKRLRDRDNVLMYFIDECTPLLKQIEQHRVTQRGVQDVRMEEFLSEMKERMLSVKNTDEKNALKAELESVLNSLEQSQKVVQDIEQRMMQSGYGMEAKGKRIGEALAAVPLKDRGRILSVAEGGTSETEAVLKAMASHRTSWLSFTKAGREGILDVKKSANMFKEFKEKFKDLKSSTPQSDRKATEPDGTSNKLQRD